MYKTIPYHFGKKIKEVRDLPIILDVFYFFELNEFVAEIGKQPEVKVSGTDFSFHFPDCWYYISEYP